MQKVLVENTEALEISRVECQNHYMEGYLPNMELDFERIKNNPFILLN